MASYQSVVNINIIMKFFIGHKAFVSPRTLSHCVLLSLSAAISLLSLSLMHSLCQAVRIHHCIWQSAQHTVVRRYVESMQVFCQTVMLCFKSEGCYCLFSRFTLVSVPGGSSGKALGYGLDGPGSIPGVGEVEIFLHSFVSRLVLGSTQPPIK